MKLNEIKKFTARAKLALDDWLKHDDHEIVGLTSDKITTKEMFFRVLESYLTVKPSDIVHYHSIDRIIELMVEFGAHKFKLTLKEIRKELKASKNFRSYVYHLYQERTLNFSDLHDDELDVDMDIDEADLDLYLNQWRAFK